jgi:hypothetical protein
MPDIHAKEFSASASGRWINCPPSVRLSASFPDSSTDYAKEGTLAHSLAELMLNYINLNIPKKEYKSKIKEIESSEYYSVSMTEYINDYVNEVIQLFDKIKESCPGARLLTEVQVSYDRWAPGGFGTSDVVILADDTAYVIDLKYGKGVEVSAVENSQLMLYGLGVYDEFNLVYDIQEMHLIIMQPRLAHRSDYVIAADDLVRWADEVVVPAVKKVQEDTGEFKTGEHCRFCKAAAICKARSEEALSVLKHDMNDLGSISDDEVKDLLDSIDRITKWCEIFKDYQLERALNGETIEGYKLVEGRSVRKYSDEDEVAKALTGAGYEEAMLYERKMLGITAMEKMVGKKNFADICGNLIVKPAGKPALVPESDKRPALNSIKDDFNDEEEEVTD